MPEHAKYDQSDTVPLLLLLCTCGEPWFWLSLHSQPDPTETSAYEAGHMVLHSSQQAGMHCLSV